MIKSEFESGKSHRYRAFYQLGKLFYNLLRIDVYKRQFIRLSGAAQFHAEPVSIPAVMRSGILDGHAVIIV